MDIDTKEKWNNLIIGLCGLAILLGFIAGIVALFNETVALPIGYAAFAVLGIWAVVFVAGLLYDFIKGR